MSITSTTVIKLNANTQLNTPADLRKLTDGEAMKQLVSDSYGQLDIPETFEALVDCGKLLQLALFAADEQPCSDNILLILSKYQNLVHKSFETCHSFITSSIIALGKHKEALEILGFAEDSEVVEMLPDVLEYLADCYNTASEMESKANEQAQDVGGVTDIAEGALIQANKDHLASVEKNKNYDEMIGKLNAEKKKNEELLKRYNSAVEQLAKDKNEAAQAASTARDRAFALDLTGAIMGGIGDMAKLYASCKKPMYIAGQVGAQLLGGDKDATNGGQTTGNNASTGTVPSALDSEVMKQQAEVTKNEELVEDAKKSPDADTPEGKEKIQQAEENAQAAKDSLENTKKLLSDAAQRQSSNAVGLEEKAAMLSKKYYEMLDAQNEAAAEQAKNLETLKTMSRDKTQVEQAIFLLRFAHGILGKVKTTFLQVKTFWALLVQDCKTIASMKSSIMKDGGKLTADANERRFKFFKTKFNEDIVRGGQNWACVGRVSILAYDAVVEARKTVDGVMENLPKDTVTTEVLTKLINQCEPRIRTEALKHKGKSPPKAI